MWLELQQTLVPKLLEAVASDQSDLEWMEAGQSWLVSFDDEAAEQLSASLIMSNTKLQRLSAETSPGIMTDIGIRHLARGVASSGLTSFGPGDGSCQAPGGGGAQSSWEDVSQAELDAIDLATHANIIRRVAENDPAVIQVDLVSESLNLEGMRCFCAALQGNTFLRKINTLRLEVWQYLADSNSLAQSGVEKVKSFDYRLIDSDDAVAATKTKLAAVCAANQARNLAQAASFAMHRPYQRMMLAAMCSMDTVAAPFSADLMLTIVQHLRGSCTTPFSHTGETVQLQTFAWRLSLQGGAATSIGIGKKRGRERRKGSEKEAERQAQTERERKVERGYCRSNAYIRPV